MRASTAVDAPSSSRSRSRRAALAALMRCWPGPDQPDALLRRRSVRTTAAAELVPDGCDTTVMITVLHAAGARPEHRRRLRRPARPRLRGLLRDRRLRRRLVRLGALRRRSTFHFGDVGSRRSGPRHPRQLLAAADRRAACFAALLGIIIGPPTLRLRGDYLAIVTLGFGEIIPQVFRNGDESRHGFNLTNGPTGSRRSTRSASATRLQLGIAAAAGATSLDRVERRTGTTGSALRWLLAIDRLADPLRDSRLGRAWIAIREDEIAAGGMGIPLMRTKRWPTPSAPSSAAWRAASTRSTRAPTFPTTSSSTSRSSSSAWSSSAAWATSGA